MNNLSTPIELRGYFGAEVPFMEHIGLEPISLDENSCLTRLSIRPDLVNSRRDLHGGALMAALDFTLSAAARGHAPLRYGVITIDMTTHFYEAARSDLTVIARCSRRGRSIAFCDGEMVDNRGAVIAVGRATFKLLDLAKAS
ncbi:phenylacetic acid degradation protein [Bordetella genomosp. 10]|uniref:Phenylacetic acid degradation protein n=1 Tax=Bordetella genomosp. 10 TaxID=1416804 RepID=A0A261SLF2_9BORD|nr:PaaI family thioesterase [Bordetella genomosp. 10]OZI38248.1 phenylacetic acid degradation protein [Bordetella genomosp. 10]